ncbi:MAG: DUF4254 domain-containing protein [Saprospiraceae bacterium]|nr:DUF4254 domain-containing protein [Saprospiraceae bacterium]
MITAEYCCSLFYSSIEEYHKENNINQSCPVFESSTMEKLLIKKCWIDIIQWHLEDLIRRPDLSHEEFVRTKRRIDLSNQERTDCVEKIDETLYLEFKNIPLIENPRLNTETPAWVIDRLSILMLKIYHMQEQVQRQDANKEHIELCKNKLEILLTQKLDLCQSFNNFLEELRTGNAIMKLYRQMKMYNDPSTNPELYQNQ